MAHRLNNVHGMHAATPAWAMSCILPFSTGGHSLSHVSQDLQYLVPRSWVATRGGPDPDPGSYFGPQNGHPPEVPNRLVDHDTGGALV